MRAWLLLGLLLAMPLGMEATQDARPAPVDPALIQRYVDADPATRRQIASALEPAMREPFRIAMSVSGNEDVKQGRSQEAIRKFLATLELSGQLSIPRGEMIALINLGMIYGQSGDYTVAVRYLTGALEKDKIVNDDDLNAAVVNNLGNIYRRRGQYTLALEYYDRALESNEAANREPSIARSLNNIGLVHQEQGNFRAAIEYFLRSLAIKERIGPPEEVVSTLLNIGAVYALQGNRPQAIEYLERSLALAERFNNVRLLVGSSADLGRVLMEAQRYPESEARLNRALALAEQSQYRDQVGSVLNALANLEIARKQWTRASAHLARAGAMFEEIGDPINSGHVLSSQAAIAFERGRAVEGLALARQARDLFASIGRPTALLDAEVMLAEGFATLRRWPDAIATYQRAIDLTERGVDLVAGDMEDRFRYLAGSEKAYYGLAHAYASSARPADALAIAERGRARTLLDIMAGESENDELTPAERERRIELDTQLTTLNSRIAAERARTKPGGKLNPALAEESERLRRSRDEFYLGLDATHPRLAFARGRAPVLSAREIAETLPAKSGLVEFVAGPRGTWIMLLVPRPGAEPRLIVKPVSLPTTKLTTLAEEFTRQVSTRDLSFSVNARALYDALLGPIDADLAALDQLVVVPDGVLWDVPFQALQTPRQKFVIEEHALSYAPSASTLKELKRRSRPAPSHPRVVAFGDPRVADKDATPLPFAAREAREVAAIYGGDSSTVVTDSEATETRFRQLAPHANIVHIATHGVLDNSSPMFSYLELAGSGTSQNDGRLEGRELLNMQLDADLVVLSACETARGRIANGEGVVGLSWALFAAGASTATVSLWPVDSASTTTLMTTFHRQRQGFVLQSAVGPTARALQAAQRSLLSHAESRHPFYWAGFVVVGVP